MGKGIEIPELNQPQVQNLAQRLQLPWNGEQVAQLMAMVGGHPWLVKEALDKIARRELTLKELLKHCSHPRRLIQRPSACSVVDFAG